MSKVDFGTLLPGVDKIKHGNINPTWKGNVILEDREIESAYIKKIELRKIVIECVCAIIGRQLNIPIPKPIIILVPHQSLPDIVPEQKSLLCFGSIDMKHPNLNRLINNQQVILQELKKSEHVEVVSTFDEWIGNWDRNLGNMLYAGAGDFVFIDHEHSIAQNLEVDKCAIRNQILEHKTSDLDEEDRISMLNSLQKKVFPEIMKVNVLDLTPYNTIISALQSENLLEILKFLEERIESLYNLLCTRLRIKQIRLEI